MTTATDDARRRELLGRLFRSRHFVHARSLRRILEYICAHASDPNAPSVKEYEVAVFALGRPDTFDPKIDPIVRVSMGGIRERLAAYFANEGQGEPLRLTIPKGEYRASFEPGPTSAERAAEARQRFWAPYFDGRPTAIVFSEVLFFTDGRGNFHRNVFVNEPAEVAELGAKMPDLARADALAPSFHFVPAGEVHALLALQEAFAQLGHATEARNARFTSWDDLRGHNVIVLGSPRTNPLVASLPPRGRWRIGPDALRTVAPDGSIEGVVGGRRHREGELERRSEPALVTRMQGPEGVGCLTVVTANHGRGIEGAADLIAREDRLAAVLERAGCVGSAGFQLLVEVEMIGTEDEVLATDVKDCSPLDA